MTWALVVVDGQQWQGMAKVGLAARVADRIDALTRAFQAAGEQVFYVENALESACGISASNDKRLLCYGRDAFAGSDLARRLRQAGVDCIVLCGIGTDTLIDGTAKSALSHGFDVMLASDAHLANERGSLQAEAIIEHYNAVLAEWVIPGQVIEVLPSDDLLAILAEEPCLPQAVGW